jgi:hypothetical protein
LKSIAVQIKAFFLLTVFAANFYNVCHCRHLAGKSKTYNKTQSCEDGDCMAKHCPDIPTSGKEKDGCCGEHLVKFALLEKQTSEPVSLHPSYPATPVHQFIIPLITYSPDLTRGRIRMDRQHKHPPPDFQVLYQRFLI